MTVRVEADDPGARRDSHAVAAGRGQIAIMTQNGDAKRAGKARVIGHRPLNLGARVVHREFPVVTDLVEATPCETVQLDAGSATVDDDVSAFKTTHFGTADVCMDPFQDRAGGVLSAKQTHGYAREQAPPTRSPGFSLRKKLNPIHIEQTK